jgi:hypothetical protein
MSFHFNGAVRALALGLILALPVAPGLRADDYLPPKASDSVIAAIKDERAKMEKTLVADPKNTACRMQLGEILCDLAVNGDEDASSGAVKLFKTLHQELPQDPEILADYGNACTIYAQYCSIFTKLSWVHDGFNYLDAAVKAAPDNVGVHVVRALNSSQVPAFLNREPIARADFDWLLQHIRSNSREFTPAALRLVYYYDGIFALKHGDSASVQLLAQAETVPPPPDDRLAARIESSLKAARAKFPPVQISQDP